MSCVRLQAMGPCGRLCAAAVAGLWSELWVARWRQRRMQRRGREYCATARACGGCARASVALGVGGCGARASIAAEPFLVLRHRALKKIECWIGSRATDGSDFRSDPTSDKTVRTLNRRRRDMTDTRDPRLIYTFFSCLTHSSAFHARLSEVSG